MFYLCYSNWRVHVCSALLNKQVELKEISNQSELVGGQSVLASDSGYNDLDLCVVHSSDANELSAVEDTSVSCDKQA